MSIWLPFFPGEWCVLAWTSRYIRILHRKKENPKFNQWHQRTLEVWRQESLSQTLVARFSSDSHRIKAKDAVTVLVHKLQGYGSTNESGKGNISGSSLGRCSKKKSCSQGKTYETRPSVLLQDTIIVHPPESYDRDLGSLLGKPWPRLPLMALTSKKEPDLLTL